MGHFWEKKWKMSFGGRKMTEIRPNAGLCAAASGCFACKPLRRVLESVAVEALPYLAPLPSHCRRRRRRHRRSRDVIRVTI
jgi:hypothetical protein